MGPEYLALLLTAAISSISAGSWVVNKFLNRSYERMREVKNSLEAQARNLEDIEASINRMPLEYVLKVDFFREIQTMQDNLKQINGKLDKLMEKLFDK